MFGAVGYYANHYIAYGRRSYGSWEIHNDLMTYNENLRNVAIQRKQGSILTCYFMQFNFFFYIALFFIYFIGMIINISAIL